MSEEGDLPPQAYTCKPNDQENEDCPYRFDKLEAVFYKANPDKITYYAAWRRQTVWSRRVKGPWYYEDSNEKITIDNWNQWYPGYKYLERKDPDPNWLGQYSFDRGGRRRLAGRFNTKPVFWDPRKSTFVYSNNLSVTFPPERTPSSRPPSRAPSRAQSPEDSQDEAVVTSLLERTGQVLTSLTEEAVRRRTPEPSSVEAPGAFPETPPQKQAPTVLPTPSTEGTSTRVAAAEAPALPTVPESPTPVPAQVASSLVQGRSSPPQSQPAASITTQAPYTSRSKLPPAAVASSSKGKAPATTMSTSTSTAAPKSLGSPPEPYDGKPDKAEAFWSALKTYFYLNSSMFADDNRKIATTLTYFKVGTPAGEWA